MSAWHPRRVLFAISSLSAGGAERVITELANEFVSAGNDTAVLTLAGRTADHYELRPQVQRIALDIIWNSAGPWESLRSNLRRNRAIRDAVKSFRPDAIVSFVEETNVRMLAASMGLGLPVIVSERIDPRMYPIGRAWRAARRCLYPRSSALVVQSESVAQWARQFIRAERVYVVPNFVRTLPEVPQPGARTGVLAVGRLERQKGFDLLLRAYSAAELWKHAGGLTILGEGPERAALAVLARELGIEAWLQLPGIVKDPESWMARAAMFVLPSRFEGFPNVLIEAMAMGCPVISTNCPSGPADIVVPCKNGLLVPTEDVGALAEALRTVALDSRLRERLSAAAVEVRTRFAKEQIVQRWAELVDEVIKA